jgi:hypothetical protein
VSGGEDMVVAMKILQCNAKAGGAFYEVRFASLSSMCFCMMSFTVYSSNAQRDGGSSM